MYQVPVSITAEARSVNLCVQMKTNIFFRSSARIVSGHASIVNIAKIEGYKECCWRAPKLVK